MQLRQWKYFDFNQMNSMTIVPKGQTDNKSSLVKVMVWYNIGDNPLYEPTRDSSNDAYMRHLAS